jgi:hypothetical protein
MGMAAVGPVWSVPVTSLASSRRAYRLPPLIVFGWYRGRPVSGSRPANTRSSQVPSLRCRIDPFMPSSAVRRTDSGPKYGQSMGKAPVWARPGRLDSALSGTFVVEVMGLEPTTSTLRT